MSRLGAVVLIILGSLTIGYPAAGQVPVPPDDACAISDDKHQGDVVSALPFDVEHPVTKLLLPADSHRTQVADLGSSLSFEKASFDVMRRSNGPGQQIVGILQTEQELKGHEFYIDVDCNQRAKLVGAPDGSISVFDGVGQIGAVAVPWAYDSSGRTLETGFSIKGDTFSQWIDTSAANFPIVFDPTYSVLDCNLNGRYSNLNAAQYLDMYSSSTNYGYCAPEPLHVRRNLYQAVWAFENSVANDYGWVLTRQAGECGVIPDTWGWYDFQVPCKAHDYCYDLRKAGLSGTVTDANCDDTFYNLMLADCNDRNVVARGLCNGTALSTRQAVGPAITNPDPAYLSIFPLHILQTGSSPNICVDVFGGSVSSGADIVQWPCSYGSNQRFQFQPAAGYPGEFYIINEKSGMCLQSVGQPGLMEQYKCFPFNNAQRWVLWGSFLQNNYTIRQSTSVSKCWDVPGSSAAHGQQISIFWCNETANQRWVML